MQVRQSDFTKKVESNGSIAKFAVTNFGIPKGASCSLEFGCDQTLRIKMFFICNLFFLLNFSIKDLNEIHNFPQVHTLHSVEHVMRK